MKLCPPRRAYLSVTVLALLAAVPGVIAVGGAPVSGLSLEFAEGTTQRHYERRFDDAFPLRDEARALWAALRFGLLGEPSEGAVLGADGWLFTAEEFRPPEEVRNLGEALDEARARIEAAGAELIPVFVPDKARMVAGALPYARSERYRDRYDRLLDETRALGFWTVDLRPTLRTGADGPPAFMRTDTHWSPEGARAAAMAIAAVSDGLDPAAGFSTERTGETAFTGDLVAFADTGRWRSWTGPAPERIGLYETTEQGGTVDALFADTTIPVALVGTSFSARTEFHFVGFLKQALGADVVSHARVGQGPFAPMEEFLAGPALRTNPPRIVLWEIPERYIQTWSDD